MPHSSLHLLSLPDDVLARCFAELSFLERHQALPLTCRRFSRLVNSPQLLRTVEFDSTADNVLSAADKPGRYLPRARSFACWAVRHAAGAVQRLLLKLGAPSNSALGDPDAIWSEVLGALAACGTAGGLQEVRLCVRYCTAALPAWLPVALRSVRLLHLEVDDGSIEVDVPLTAMTALTDLRLDASAAQVCLHLSPAATLPPTLERLHFASISWGDEPPQDLPPQIAVLPALRHLVLETCAFTPEGLKPLAQLACSLEALQIDFCHFLPGPSTLASLTRLTFLDAYDFIADREERIDDVPGMLEEALEALPQLKALRVSFWGSGIYMSIPAFPRSATALQHLQHLAWDLTVHGDDALPPGGWLSGLRSLAMPGDLIAHNLATLASARQLQHLVALQPVERSWREHAPGYDEWQPAVAQWAASHPTLRRLGIEVPWLHFLPQPAPGPSFDIANKAAMQQNPTLRICSETRLAALTLEQLLERVRSPPA